MSNYIQSEGYENRNSYDSFSHQSLHDPNDSEKSLKELNNDVRNDLEDFKRCVRSMRTVPWKLFARNNGKTTGANQHMPYTDKNLVNVINASHFKIKELRVGKIMGIGKQIGGLYYFNGKQGVLLAPLNDDDDGHSHSTDASASEGERSADLKDNIISSEVMIYIFILRKH
ncbi:hypothetical protein Tco_0000441 [Tanacetum coccineum]